MSFWQRLKTPSIHILNKAEKLRWGLRVVGFMATARGFTRWLKIVLWRPQQAEVRVTSGFTLEFQYPSQFPAALVMFGDLIDPEFAFLRQISRTNWIVADVGAAIGQFTIFAAKLPCAVVHAFEPSGANIAMLNRNLYRNAVHDRVRVHQFALSNANGEARFVTTGPAWVSQLRPDASQGGEVVSVRTLTGELQRLHIDRLQILKINVAGFEPEVLEGGMPLFIEGKVDILILLLGLRSLKWYAEIASYGYRFFYYHPLEHSLYEVTSFTESAVLDHRPWPARHIIGIHSSGLGYDVIGSMVVRNLRTTA
jgi:FkbM family methyltransferase